MITESTADMEPKPAPIAVVGAGHWLLSHDRIGPRVLEMIQGRYGREVDVVDAGTSGLALIDHIQGQDLMFVVDACVFGGRPGQVITQEPELDNLTAGTTSVHQVGPAEALAVAKHLFPDKLPARVLLVLVETEGINEDTEEAACREVVGVLDEQIRAWGEGNPDALKQWN
jgi:hydrogenase maturation protease